jgi:hypothetical protein
VPGLRLGTDELAHGTIVTRDRGQPVRAVERHGHEVWRAAWDGARLVRLVVRRPDRGEVVLDTGGGEHPLFGPVHAIVVDGTRVASCGAVDWAAPRFVPPIDRPGAIPAGGGSAILDFLARQAGDAPLRYRGPYPTDALFDALLHSFAVDDPEAARGRFTEHAAARAISGLMREVDVAFHPAPHEWIWPAPGVCVELRDGVERVFVHGRPYDRGTAGHRRLLRDGDEWVATVTIADAPWCETLRVGPDGSVRDGPHPIPPVVSPLLGTELPQEIVHLLAEMLAARDGGPFAPALANASKQRRIVCEDTGDALAIARDEDVHLHALLAERIADCTPDRILELLLEAIEPAVRRLVAQGCAPGSTS